MNLKSISEDTYTALRKKCVFPTITKTWINERNAVLTDLASQEVVLCGDGRCDSPGHSAKYCTYTFLDAQSNKVVDFKVVSVTQVSNSNAMELHGFKEALKTIEEDGVQVSTISTDRHPQIVKEMRINNPEKFHEFDPWHVAKGVSKKLTAEAKRRSCEDLGAWIPSIINHLWWCAQNCAEDAVLLKEKWVSVIHHVTNRHDWPGNRHYHCCDHEPLSTLALYKVEKLIVNKRVLSDVAKLSSYHQTENIRFQICGDDVPLLFPILTRLYIVFFFAGTSWQQCTKMRMLKGNKLFLKGKLYSERYAAALMRLVFDEVFPDPSKFVAQLKTVPVPKHLCAEFERASKEDIIAAHVSRFSRAVAGPQQAHQHAKTHIVTFRIWKLLADPEDSTCWNDHPNPCSK
uniref:Transposase n=1 Tax=Neogobius melanostomus TaxID=47308 RepID=A0A8C6TKS8_9GOBI